MDQALVERARHLAHCFYNPRLIQLCQEDGIPEAEMNEGFRLAAIDKRIRHEMYGYYGNPAYGSWPAEAHDYRLQRFAELSQVPAK